MKNRSRTFAALSPILILGLTSRDLRAAEPKFYSVFTDLSHCTVDASQQDTPGELASKRCTGAGRYEVQLSPSTFEDYLDIRSAQDEFSMALRLRGEEHLEKHGNRLEWRFADGQPFAIIVRTQTFNTSGVLTGEQFSNKYKTGDYYVARGLRRHEEISEQVDATAPNALDTIRKQVDAAYRPAE